MGWKKVVVTREDLFERVWSRPVIHLAAEAGISDVAFAKMCRRMDIPLPGRGYWARRSAGQKPPIPKLRPPKAGVIASYVEQRFEGDAAEIQARDQIRQQIQQDVASAEPLSVPAMLSDPHPLVARSLLILQKAKPEQPEKALYRRRCLHMLAHGEALVRAALIMDTVIKALDMRGYSVEATVPRSVDPQSSRTASRTQVHIGDSVVQIGLYETIRRIPLPYPEPPKPRGPFGYVPRPRRQYEYRPTGQLHLFIRNVSLPGAAVNWGDHKAAKVESSLNEFVASIVVAAEVQRLGRIQAEKERLEAISLAKRRRAIERINAADETLSSDAKIRLLEWRHARDIQGFADAVAANAAKAASPSAPDSQVTRWLEWARREVAYLDRCALRDFDKLRGDRKEFRRSGTFAWDDRPTVSEALEVALATVEALMSEDGTP